MKPWNGPNFDHTTQNLLAAMSLIGRKSNAASLKKAISSMHDVVSGDYTLDINPVDLEDDARFQCQIGAADGIAPIRSRYATLTVKVPPEPPKLLPSGDELKTVEGRQVELRCESRGGKPASEVRFKFLE